MILLFSFCAEGIKNPRQNEQRYHDHERIRTTAESLLTAMKIRFFCTILYYPVLLDWRLISPNGGVRNCRRVINGGDWIYRLQTQLINSRPWPWPRFGHWFAIQFWYREISFRLGDFPAINDVNRFDGLCRKGASFRIMRSHFDSHSLFASRKTWLVREDGSPKSNRSFMQNYFSGNLLKVWKWSLHMRVEREGRKRSCKIANQRSVRPTSAYRFVRSWPGWRGGRGEARRGGVCLRPCPSSRPCASRRRSSHTSGDAWLGTPSTVPKT